MGVFRDLELEWDGNTYLIKSSKIMGAISRIEEIITLSELQMYAQRKTAPIAKLAMAFGSVLRYAGADVADEEIYAKAVTQSAGSDDGVMLAVMSVMQIMIPPDAKQTDSAGGIEKNSEATAGRKEALSKQPTKRRSQGANG